MISLPFVWNMNERSRRLAVLTYRYWVSAVPAKAITMGVGTIFKAREIILMAWSLKKAPIVKKAVEGEISGEVPATYLQLSDHVEFVLDEAAASSLTRFDTPWLVKDC